MTIWNYTVTIAGNPATPPAGLTKNATITGYGTVNHFDGINMTVGDVQTTAMGTGNTITFSVRFSTSDNKVPFKDGSGSYSLTKVKIGTEDHPVTDCHILGT